MFRNIVWLLSAGLLMTGCIREDMSSCPPVTNVTLMFRYSDKDGVDRFQDKHDVVDIAVFDPAGRCVYNRTIDRGELADFQGHRFFLPPGDYRAVCWGNVSEHAQLSPLRSGEAFADSYLTLETGAAKRTTDQVMYAPRPAAMSRGLETGDVFRIRVPEEGQVQETMDFVSAYTEFKIQVRGLVDADAGMNVAPQVELTELPVSYDFAMNARSARESYAAATEYVSTAKGPEARAHFYTGNFEADAPIVVRLFSRVDGRPLKDVSLAPYLLANAPDFSTMLERSVTVLVEFEGKDAKVTVTVSPWIGTGVHPIL